jgi:hypothetical protein
MGDGSTEQVEVRWDDVDPASYASLGTFTVDGTVVRGSADHPVATVTVTDATDPVVTLAAGTPDGQAGWWVTEPVTVSATATDASGVESVTTSVDLAPWAITAGSATSVQVSGDGTHEVRARATDTTGNESQVETVELRIDATDPVSRATYDTGRLVTVRAADATSGLARTEVRVGTAAWTAYTAPVRIGDAATTVQYRAVDQAGNVEPANSLSVPAAGQALAVSAVAASTSSARYGATAPVTVRVSGAGGVPSGTVRVLAGDVLVASGPLADGRARLAVDTTALGVGDHSLRVLYDGSASHGGSSTMVTLRVTPAVSSTHLRVVPSADGSRATARVRVRTDPSSQLPERVRAALLRRGKVVRSTWLDLSDTGRARWTVSAARAGTYVVRVVTPGSEILTRSADTGRVRLR